ncbi:MAG: arginine--tRNA ligase [Thiomargarita sp.]|nr:arginine--tRNA ligase [Thiomargarita sp.]
MKIELYNLFINILLKLQKNNLINPEINIKKYLRIERTRNPQHGDFACNIAMILAKQVKKNPRELATLITSKFSTDDFISKVEIAGPGFINIFLTKQTYYNIVDEILTEKDNYGRSQIGAGQSVLIEFVSANPTGPLHVGHGRGAAYGAALADLLTYVGYKVHKEYYVNDAGRQMNILATSVWLRYLELCGEEVVFPVNAYQGDYIWDIAADLHRQYNSGFQHQTDIIFKDIPPDEPKGGDKELHIDALIQRCKQLLTNEQYQIIFAKTLEVILTNIRQDLIQFGVNYDEWFHESQLTQNDWVTKAIEQLKLQQHTYEKDGALWFCSTKFGDEKDRVLIRENGEFTYFASDIAYHLNKLERGFDHLINIWGADHHGYTARVKAAMMALGTKAEKLSVLLVQFAVLYRGKERLPMSTRSGEFITLRELREEVGGDATRFFYIQRKSEQHLNFDLELAKSQSNENPVYYIQYAHARISSVIRQLKDRNITWDYNPKLLENLTNSHEQALMVTLSNYPEVVEQAANNYEPHLLTYYLRQLAQDFHTYYDAHKILVDDDNLRNARLSLIISCQQILKNALTLINVNAPKVM